MKLISELTAAQLKTALEKAHAKNSALIDEMIEAGRGHERPSETANKTDNLSLRFNEAMRLEQNLRFEAKARETYHGSLRPIKRASNPRPRKYASAAERQAAYRARLEETGIVQIATRFERRTAETLERISEARMMPVNELIRQIVLHSLANNDWYQMPRYARTLTQQSSDDRRRATKFKPVIEDDDEIEDDENA